MNGAAVNGVSVADRGLKPYSRRSAWNPNNLARLCGPVHGYQWIKGFGNVNCKGGPIELADPEDGLARVAHDIEHGRNIILLCYEADPKSCHQWQVAEVIAGRFGCEVKHLVSDSAQLRLMLVRRNENAEMFIIYDSYVWLPFPLGSSLSAVYL